MNNKLIIDLICVGNLKEKYLKDMQQEYVKRLSKYSKLNIIEIKESNLELSKQIEKEGKDIKNKIDLDSYIIVLDIQGKSVDTIEFSDIINDIVIYKSSKITFIIGGSNGLSLEIKKLAQNKISFSKLTFPHQLFRCLFLEQIYRVCMINNNCIYHK